MLRVGMERVLIVGAGATGALTASVLKQIGVKTEIVEKSRGSGGRMTTSRSSFNDRCTVDLGAQYISVTPDYASKHEIIYSELLSEGILKPLSAVIEGQIDKDCTTKHYVIPDGFASLVKHFLHKADPKISYGQTVSHISVAEEIQKKWTVVTQSGIHGQFDVVILTMPVPQLLQLHGDVQSIIDADQEVKSKLLDVAYSSRFVLGLYYSPGTELNLPWAAKYITDNPCIRFIAVDNIKRGRKEKDFGTSLLVHTSVPFGIQHLDKEKDEVKPLILQHLHDILPNLPDAREIKCHKWRYSQVHKPYTGSPGCVVVHRDPLLILAGDGFKHSNFDGCVESALAVHDIIHSLTNKQSSG